MYTQESTLKIQTVLENLMHRPGDLNLNFIIQ